MRQYVKSLDLKQTTEYRITKENHRTITFQFCCGNGRKCNADDAWYKPEWYFTQVKMGWRPVVVQFGIQILILAFHFNSLCVEVYSLEKITFKKSIIAGTFAGLCYCWNIKLIQNWVLCCAYNWMITLRAVVSPGRTLRYKGRETTASNRLHCFFHRAAVQLHGRIN